MRLDQAIAARGLLPTRSRARDAIRRGHVTVDGRTVSAPAFEVSDRSAIVLADPSAGYVSRAAVKLAHALDRFGYNPVGRVALDIGASTGGFTQVLLERGAVQVVAVDVGRGQLAPMLASDPRVRLQEGVNARGLTRTHTGGLVGAIVSDVSFISQRLVVPPALALATDDAFAVILIKPQFELGPDARDGRGVVRDAQAAAGVASQIAAFVGAQAGWQVDGVLASPILGGDGNREFLLGARRRA